MHLCPSSHDLTELLNGDLNETERQELENHLGECPDCQQALLSLSGATAISARWDRWQNAKEQMPDPPLEFLERLKVVPLPHPAPRPDGPAAWPIVPGYDIVGELGHGGMAVVYKALQRGLNRQVALKMILAGEHAQPRVRARFRTEAEAVARLQHPNIVQVFETGEHNGLPYLSMELMDGGTLAQVLSRDAWIAPQEVARAAELVETLARAIHHAHQLGVVHRDLKPANILVRREVGDGNINTLPSAQQLKIADFGLAQYQDDDAVQTHSGAVMGTPCYMAPEQAQARRGEIGPATDVHALGTILYEMLTGRPPFAATTAVDSLVRVSFDEPLPPRHLQHALPHDLDTICLKCLRKLPRQRYVTALELAEDLRRFRNGEPIHARPVSRLERAVKWARRKPALAALLAGIIAVTVLAFAGISYSLQEARHAQKNESKQRQIAEQALERAERSVYLGNVAQARSQWLLNNLPAAATLLDRCQPDRRGWEWHLLNSFNHADLLTITDTGGPFVDGLAYSPNGRRLAFGGGNPFSGNERGVVAVLDADSGRVHWRRDDLRYLVRDIAFSPDGRLLASGGGNWYPPLPGELKIWDADSGQLLQELRGHDSDIVGLAFSPDGSRLASASGDQTVRIWDVQSGKELLRLKHTREASSVVFSLDGRLLISSGADACRVWEAGTGKPLAVFPHAHGTIAMSPDGKRLASIQAGGTKVWQVDFEPDKELAINLVRSVSGHETSVKKVAFSSDGGVLATACADGTLRIWDIISGREQATCRGHEGRVAAISFHPEGRTIATGGEQPGEVKIWDLTRPIEYAEAVSFADERRDIAAVCFTDDRLLVLGAGGYLRHWDRAKGFLVKEQALSLTSEWLGPATTAAFSGDGCVLAAVSLVNASAVKVIDTTTGALKKELRGHTLKVRHVACDRTGARVATGAYGLRDGRFLREVKVWDTATGNLLRDDTSFEETCDGLALSADGAWLAEGRRNIEQAPGGARVGSGPSAVLISDAAGVGPASARLPALDGVVRGLAFSRDGLLAAASDAGAVRLWDKTSKPLHPQPMKGPPGLSAIAFNPDASRLAGMNRERVQVWDVESGQDVLFLTGAEPRPNDNGFNPVLAWSPDGACLAASNWNRVVSVWDSADSTAAGIRAARRTHAAARALDWHRIRAATAARAEATFAYSFHRSRLDALTPLAALPRRARGDFYASHGAWQLARADFAAPFAAGFPEQALGWADYALVLLETDGHADFERLRSLTLERWAETDDLEALEQVVHASGLAPLSAAESKRFLHAARRYREAHPNEWRACDSLALACYRAGQWEEAAELAHTTQKARGALTEPLTWMILALVHLRQGHPDRAAPYLAKVDTWQASNSKMSIPGVMLLSDDWRQWLESRILRREAESPLTGLRDRKLRSIGRGRPWTAATPSLRRW